MSDIFKEVDDALKKEKVEAFWENYGIIVIISIISVIVATGAYSFYSSWTSSVNEEKTGLIIELQKDPQGFDLSKLDGLNPDQKSLAKLYLANDYLEKDMLNEAFLEYDTIRQNEGAAANIRGIATYYARNMILGGQIEGDLSDISLGVPSIWDNHFKFQKALYTGSVQKQPESAIPLLDELIENAADNQSLLQQAQQLKYVYEYDLDAKEGQ